MRKILLVEDEDTLRDVFALIMSSQPYDVDTAEHGQQALQLCEQKTYDLILLDLMMHILDGVGFLKQFNPVRSDRTKIIVLSNLSSGIELETAMSLGVERSILKASMSPKELLAMVRYELEAT